jgi:hypothetical protein
MEDAVLVKVNRIARVLLAACLIGGPLAGLVVRAAVPASSTASVARSVADYGRHTGATQLLLIADGFLILLVPAALAATALAWRRAPVLSLLGGILSLFGWVAIVMLAAQDQLFAETGRAVYAHDQATAIADHWSTANLVSIYLALFVAGHLFGTALLGAALWRARAIPRWAAACVGLSMPLHLITVLTAFKAGDVAAWAVLLAGFAMCVKPVLQGRLEPSSRPSGRAVTPVIA